MIALPEWIRSSTAAPVERFSPAVRLLAAGLGTLLLLAWTVFIQGPTGAPSAPSVESLARIPPTHALTAALCLGILWVLFPVRRSPSRLDRWLARLLAIFPAALLIAFALWLAAKTAS